jgi:type VI protein secretion system component VasF
MTVNVSPSAAQGAPRRRRVPLRTPRWLSLLVRLLTLWILLAMVLDVAVGRS